MWSDPIEIRPGFGKEILHEILCTSKVCLTKVLQPEPESQHFSDRDQESYWVLSQNFKIVEQLVSLRVSMSLYDKPGLGCGCVHFHIFERFSVVSISIFLNDKAFKSMKMDTPTSKTKRSPMKFASFWQFSIAQIFNAFRLKRSTLSFAFALNKIGWRFRFSMACNTTVRIIPGITPVVIFLKPVRNSAESLLDTSAGSAIICEILKYFQPIVFPWLLSGNFVYR